MDTNLETSLRRVLVHEGGLVDDPRDPGGRTAYGITSKVYVAYRRRKGLPVQDVFKITAEEVVEIYRIQYWNAIKAHVLPDGLDYCLFDAAVNSGPVQAIKWLQRAIGVDADGQLGQMTLDAVESHPNVDGLIAEVCRRRMLFLQALATWKIYGKGWTTRVQNVQRVAQAMATGNVGPTPIFSEGGERKALLTDARKAPATVVADASAGGGVTLSGGVTWLKEQLDPYAGMLPHIDTILAWLAVAGVLIAAGAGAYSWYARRKAADLADRLDTKPKQLVTSPIVSGESDDVDPTL